jgi:starch phosphorylase
MPSPVPSADILQQAIVRYARYSLGRPFEILTGREVYIATSLAVREVIIEGMLDTEKRVRAAFGKRVYYLSMEFLLGRALTNNLLNLGLLDVCRQALASLGFDLDEVVEEEPDPALGNGGLGRLAACFLDSMATLGIAGYGYGINYEFGLFRQAFRNGRQEERPDEWRSPGSPWLMLRPERAHRIPMFGTLDGGAWVPGRVIVGVPSDIPVVGWQGRTVNWLRLYTARASDEFDMAIFNTGDYVRAVDQKIQSESISKVLYPADSHAAGRELRLMQEYFFVACALRDILQRHGASREDLLALPRRVAIQLNDTHPALAVAELMRILVDERSLDWDTAWRITTGVIAYTNHTLLPEALETWPVGLLQTVLPRHVPLVRDINDRLMELVERRWPGDDGKKRVLSLFDENNGRCVRMAHLAIVGSHSVNGVSRLHGKLLAENLVPDFHAMWPERFNSKTNGVTHRRWLLLANPALAALLTELLGDGWITDLEALKGLERFQGDAGVLDALARIKRDNKDRLAGEIKRRTEVAVDPSSLFDTHAKRLHEYKRQLLNALRIAHEYLELADDGKRPAVPRTYVFAGKAAPGYVVAKAIIELVNAIAATVNADPKTRGWMRVAFVPDYRVTLAERIIPATDVSEQISTAGMEASGTGNMKFMMNGALTVGTLDGANIEMLEAAGAENLFIFGLTAEQVAQHRRDGSYSPRAVVETDARVRRVFDAVRAGRFDRGRDTSFAALLDGLLDADPYFVLADLGAFLEVQAGVGALFADKAAWHKKALLNVARSGRFSSDRTIREYASEIWGVAPQA